MDQAKHFLTQFTGPESYLVYFFILTGCGIGLPFNSDLILIASSVLAALGYFKLSLLMPIAFLGLLTGDTINFFVARKFGPKLLARPPFKWILSEQKVKAAEHFIRERGERFVFFIRFLPLIRTALFFTAGSLQVRPVRFYLLNGSATLLYLAGLMNLAYAAGENSDALVTNFKKVQFTLLWTAIGLVVAVLIRKKMKRASLS